MRRFKQKVSALTLAPAVTLVAHTWSEHSKRPQASRLLSLSKSTRRATGVTCQFGGDISVILDLSLVLYPLDQGGACMNERH
ncbi:hypothetical protein OE88DRAFT_755524 [Heliocybe sulcata]|uniref:Secreted protein n=1 Tax=Heliocybe sulcata TaxID=5364 RepID=A0A5C3MS49_9AGAM|nr:hypothetical protein OE88DRAFT_755524 [Heliocybe sulcata]